MTLQILAERKLQAQALSVLPLCVRTILALSLLPCILGSALHPKGFAGP